MSTVLRPPEQREEEAAGASLVVRKERGSVERLAGLFSLPQEDGKEAKRQSRLLVSMARSEAETLVKDYLSQQGSPFSDNAKPPTLIIDDLPVLDKTALPSSPWKRLAISLSAFLSFRGWLASVLAWQRSLNPKSRDLLNSLDLSRNNSLAISSALGALLGQTDHPSPSSPTISNVFKQKVAGYMICKHYCDWLAQTEKDLVVLVAESSV
ncbi:PREDICTED: cardiotrophin-2-like [Nanorana parkeri]|uniref:cardiotrophin-2-like n=1 Tax=Nanorana parkeri TaxID=125878 RepID=UPI0008546841|nr:PREDICTED: cardiotrophin-2-like [Nanorana parkeri]